MQKRPEEFVGKKVKYRTNDHSTHNTFTHPNYQKVYQNFTGEQDEGVGIVIGFDEGSFLGFRYNVTDSRTGHTYSIYQDDLTIITEDK